MSISQETINIPKKGRRAKTARPSNVIPFPANPQEFRERSSLKIPVRSVNPGADITTLTIGNESLIDYGINQGDQLVVERGTFKPSEIENGKLVVALIHGRLSVGFFYNFGRINVLRSGNPKDEIVLYSEQVEIVGLVLQSVKNWN